MGDETLGRLVDELIDWDLTEYPVRATAIGLTEHDDRLGDFSADAFGARHRKVDEFRERFEAVDRDSLDLDDSIDLDLALAELRGRQIQRDWEEWRRSPEGYLSTGLYGAYQLFLHRLRPDEELVDAAVSRLSQVPDVLERGRENLVAELASPLIVDRALGVAQAGAMYCREFLPAEVEDEGLSKRLAEAGEAAAGHYEEFTGFLTDFKERAAGSYALGEERYSALLREREGLPHDLSSLHERGVEAHRAISEEMAGLSQEIAGTDDFRSVIVEANEDHAGTPEDMRAEYEEWTARARAFLVERELVTFPEGEACKVVPSPPFQRPVLAVASYMRPPAFTDSRVGHFFVPFPPEGTSDEDVQRRLTMNSRVIIPSISVHEAYPGHHWHLAVVASTDRPLRKVYGTSYFAEGWGLYTEQMMREQGFFPDRRMELLQLDMRLWRAARIVVDTALHAGDMDVEQAATYMHEQAGLSEPVARAEVGRYCAWPTQAASYLTGALEIERIRERYFKERDGDLRTFHDTIAASGVLPLALAERAVMEG